MPNMTKIATCCYCGTRAALVLRGTERHELSCATCGAPLHDMKIVPAANVDRKAHKQKRSKAGKKGRDAIPKAVFEGKKTAYKARKRKKPGKRKNGVGRLFRDVFDDAFDVIEDIFD